MGAYLSQPQREKSSVDEDCKSFRYGASSMQGWRVSQEDAHNCCPDFDEENSTALFAVYDGHGGAEVAQYTAMRFPGFLKDMPVYAENNLSQALEEAFLEFDKSLTKPEIIHELKEIAGVQSDPEADEDEEAEAAMLYEEASMPIEKLLERYGRGGPPNIRNMRKKDDFQSPVVRAKKLVPNGDGDEMEGDCVDSSEDVIMKLEEKLVNGHSDSTDGKGEDLTASDSGKNSTKEEILPDSSDSKDDDAKDCSRSKLECVNDQVNSTVDSTSNKSETLSSSGAQRDSSGECDSSSGLGVGSSNAGLSCVESSEVQASSTGSTAAAAAPSSTTTEEEQAAEEPCSSSGRTRKKRKGIIPEEGEDESSFDEDEEDTEDDEDEEDEDEAAPIWGSDDDDEDEDEDGDSGEEDEDEEGGGYKNMLSVSGGEEPGSDSGCTAVVAVLRQKDLYVANAGDSRCIVCRAGKALDMSVDHKPEDEEERNRITKAGGCVTPDGRVNGGLNLSRAIGDHCYKRKEDLSAKEQMISALPDVKLLELCEEDEFMVLACDGIWNVMNSQDVVEFVQHRLITGNQSLSSIAEEMFEFCLAPDTSGDGTGCDNMTCIIVDFHAQRMPSTDKSPATLRQPAESAEAVEEEGSNSSSAQRSAEEEGSSNNSNDKDLSPTASDPDANHKRKADDALEIDLQNDSKRTKVEVL